MLCYNNRQNFYVRSVLKYFSYNSFYLVWIFLIPSKPVCYFYYSSYMSSHDFFSFLASIALR